jgi:dTDP-4-dehydrorhamnose reductase
MAGTLIVVTGSSGLLGANLAVDLHRLGHEVIALYNQHSVLFPGICSVQCDLRDSVRFSDLIQRFHPKWIVHAAALTDVDWCEEHTIECLSINSEAARFVASVARSVRARLAFVSTDSIFNGEQGSYTESDQADPVNVYATSKLEGEVGVKHEIPDSVIVRTNIYGWNAQPKLSLAEWIISKLRAGERVKGFDDVIFSPLLANDLGNLIHEIIVRELEGVYHAGARDSCSKYDFAIAVAQAFGYPSSLIERSSIRNAQFKARRPRNTSLCSDRLARDLATEMPDVRSGIYRFKSLGGSGLPQQLKSAFQGGVR